MLRRTFLLGALPLAGCATCPVTLPRTQQFTLRAADGVERVLQVGPPAGPAPAGGWPVLMVLDGNALFAPALHLARNLARRAGFSHALVVGIAYPEAEGFDDAARARDFTPPVPGRTLPTGQGGADRFLDFLAQQVAPRLAGEHGADVRQMHVFGHSYGGLCALHALFTRPGLFRSHVAASPSVWWQDRFLLREADALAQRQVAAGTPTQRVLLTVGSLEQTPPPGTPPARAAGLRARAQVDGVRALAERLATVPGVECTLRELAGETHGSSALPALQRAVDFVLGPRA